MDKALQTEEVKTYLYHLTLQAVKKWVHRYYKQFRGDVNDLAGEFYVQFLTPKSREEGKEASLLDKFDDSITTLPYLVKIAVQRMLIDRSRQDCRPTKSVDHFVDEYGDCIMRAFALTTTEDEEESCTIADTREFTRSEVASLKMKWFDMTEAAKKSFIKQFEEVKNVINPNYREVFEELIISE